MKNVIFVLWSLLLTWELTSCLCKVTISPSNPVQFWTVDKDTYNETEVCSIEPVFWCQPWQADDEITTQIKDTTPLTRELFDNTSFEGNINSWDGDYNTPSSTSGQTWLYDAGSGGAKITTAAAVIHTKGLKQDAHSLNDFYTIETQITLAMSSYPATMEIWVYFYNAANAVIFSHILYSTGANITNFAISYSVSKANVHHFALTVEQGSGGAVANGAITVNYFRVRGTTYREPAMDIYGDGDALIASEDFTVIGDGIWQESFSPDEYGIECQEITLKIRDKYDNSILARSDCLDINTVQSCTELIQYSNSGDFDDLDFDPSSPSTDFYLRVPAVFFEEDFPDEYESIELSSSEIVQLSSQVKHKKLLDIGFIPFYFAEKIQLVLAHDSVVIQDMNWIKADGMIKTPGNKRYPLRKWQALLTDKDFIKRNVL